MSHQSDPNQPVSHYPVLLDLSARPVVVVGGGEVAEVKVAGLVAAGARVTVIAPHLTPTLRQWAKTARLAWLPHPYREGDLEGAFLAFAATDTPDTNQAVWEEAQRRRIPLNSADDPPRCSFILPAVHRQGELVVAVSTGGKAPALAVRLRDRIAGILGEGFAPYLELLGSYRREITDRSVTFAQRREVWYRIVDSDALDLVRVGDLAAARRLVSRLIEEAAPSPDEGAA